MAWSLMGNYEEIQHQRQHHTSHWKSVWKAPSDEWGGSQQNPESNWSAWCSPNHGEEMETQDGMATSQDPLAWRRQFCKGQWKEQERGKDRRRDGKITSRYGREWGLEIPTAAEDREGWKGIVATSSVVPRRPPRLRDWDDVGQWPIFHGPVILPYILKTIWWTNVITGILDPCDACVYHIKCMWISDQHFMVQWFCLISWRFFDGGVLIQCNIKFDLQIYMQIRDLYFVVQWFSHIFSILFDEQASFFAYWFWYGPLTCISWLSDFESFTYFVYSGLLKFDMKIFVNVARLEIGQLFTQGVRWGHPCTLDTFLVF